MGYSTAQLKNADSLNCLASGGMTQKIRMIHSISYATKNIFVFVTTLTEIGFSPTTSCFYKRKNGDTFTYEVFIEPKGKHLQDKDRWKEDLLKIIRDQADTLVLAENRKYRILGVGRFYNEDIENEFKDELNETLQQGTS